MEITDFGIRLAKLREAKGISARDMSHGLGKSASYINKIELDKGLPSMVAFFDICDFLGISPKDFFDDDNNNPVQINEFITDYKNLDDAYQTSIAGMVRSLRKR